jgi:hypothetical protein
VSGRRLFVETGAGRERGGFTLIGKPTAIEAGEDQLPIAKTSGSGFGFGLGAGFGSGSSCAWLIEFTIPTTGRPICIAKMKAVNKSSLFMDAPFDEFNETKPRSN